MLAPQAVINAQDELIDYLLQVVHGEAEYEWTEVRGKALVLINAIREDVGIDKSPIGYNGNR
jgi:hypothetical protein